MPQPYVMSCRAECEHDVKLFQTRMQKAGFPLSNLRVESSFLDAANTRAIPDRKVEFSTYATPRQAANMLLNQVDAHVMCESLRPVALEKNPLDREGPFSGRAPKVAYELRGVQEQLMKASATLAAVSRGEVVESVALSGVSRIDLELQQKDLVGRVSRDGVGLAQAKEQVEKAKTKDVGLTRG